VAAEPATPPRAQRVAPWAVVGGTAVVTAGILGFAFSRAGAPPEAAAQQTPALAAAAPEAKRPAFDGARSFKDLEKQVAFGPRVPNRPGHRECRDYLVETLKPLADQVERQDFTRSLDGKALQMSNVVARWKGSGAAKDGILLAAHWDTRPTADYERTAERRNMPIPGANDGASGVAALLEIGRLFKQSPPPVPVMLVFFDGEDFGPGVDRMFLGSRYFADHLPADVPKRGILLDMIGDRDLEIPQEGYSMRRAGDVMAEVYAAAERLGLGRQFTRRFGGPIEDDHVPLQEKGLRIIDLIDFSYGPGHSWWHTLEDTPDKCSPASLKAVGDVVAEWVYSRK
jgi:glutaminyl-peptide cyclotransferase